MPLGNLNNLLAAPWARFRETVETHLRSSLSGGWKVAKIDIAAPFGYLSLSTKGGQLAIPEDPKGWSLTLRKKLPIGQVVVHVDAFRLLVTVPLDDTDTDRPRVVLDRVKIEPQVRLRVPGVFPVAVELNAFEKVRDAEGNVSYRAALDVPPSGGSANSLSGILVLRLFPDAVVSFNGDIRTSCWSGPIHFHKPLPVSDTTKAQLQVVARNGLPRRWGEGAATPLPSVPAGTRYRSQALAIEDAIRLHMAYEPDPNDPTVPPTRLGNIFDNRYEVRQLNGKPVYSFLAFDGECDSAIWTGHYLAAECFRYAAVTSPADRQAALARVLLALSAIENLFRLTYESTGGAVRGLLCRAAFPKVRDETLPTLPPFDQPDDPSQYYGPVPIDGVPWYGLGCGSATPSRDQYLGVLLGLACALKFVGDASVQVRVTSLIADIVSFLLENGWNVPIPIIGSDPLAYEVRTTYIHEFHQQIAILRLGASARPDLFLAPYEVAAKAADLMWVSVWGSTVEPVDGYYKFNLDHGFMAILFLLETDRALREQYMRAFRMLRRAVGHHRNAWFDLVWVLAESAHAQERAGNVLDQPGAPGGTVADEVRALLAEWLRRRDRVAGPSGLPLKVTPFPQALKDLYPASVAEYAPGKWRCRYPLQVDVRPGSGMDFLWQRDPFSTHLTVEDGAVAGIDGDEPGVEAPGVDFLLAYWTAAYSGIVP